MLICYVLLFMKIYSLSQVSLPGNLTLRYEDPCGAACTVVANDIVPRGTKFGPMVGDILR